MTLGNDPPEPLRPAPVPPSGVPPTDRRLMAVAGVLLAIPVVALLWVPSYAHEDPRLWGFPFFYWYQFLWVFLCSGCTYAAYRLTVAARRGGDQDGRR